MLHLLIISDMLPPPHYPLNHLGHLDPLNHPMSFTIHLRIFQFILSPRISSIIQMRSCMEKYISQDTCLY